MKIRELEEAWLFLVCANPIDAELISRAAESCNLKLVHIRSCAEFSGCLAVHRPAVVIAAKRLPDGDWRQILWAGWDVVETPAMILLADHLSPKERYRARTLDVAWILERPFDEISVIRSVLQARRRWSAEYSAGVGRC